MFPLQLHTSQTALADTLTTMQPRRVILYLGFLVITITTITQGIYVPEETTTQTPPGGGRGTISSVLDPPVSTKTRNNASRTPILADEPNEESAVYYEYETVSNDTDEEFCTFTLHVSSPSNKNSDGGCISSVPGDNKPQGSGKTTVVSGTPGRVEVGLKRRLNRAERRIDLLERQLFRQSELMAKLQNQMFGLVKTEESEYNHESKSIM